MGETMNLGDFRTSIRLKIDDVNSTRFDDSQIRIILNEALQHVYRELIRNNIYTNKAQDTITFTAGTQEVALPTDLQKLLYVQDAGGSRISIIEETYSRGSESLYAPALERSVYIRDTGKTKSLGYYVCPNSGFTLTITYLIRTTTFATLDNDEVEINFIPPEHHDVVVLYTVVLLGATDEDISPSFIALYTNALASMIESASGINELSQEVVQDADY